MPRLRPDLPGAAGSLPLTSWPRAVEAQPALAAQGGADPRAVLGADLLGEIAHHPQVVGTLRRQLETLGEQGWQAAISSALALTAVG